MEDFRGKGRPASLHSRLGRTMEGLQPQSKKCDFVLEPDENNCGNVKGGF